MSLCKSKAQKKAKAAQKDTESKVVDAGEWLSHEIGHLGSKLQHGVEAGASALASGVQASGPYVQEGLGRAQDLGDTVRAKSEKVADKVADRTADSRAKAQEKYAGAASALAAKFANTDTPEQFDTFIAKLTGDKKAVARAKKAAAKASKEYAKKQKKAEGGHKGLLVLGLLVAGGIAGVAAWRASRPVQDPWKTPASNSPRVTASPVNQTTVAAGTGAKVDDVKDPTAPVNQENTAQQAAQRASEGVKSVAEDAKATLNEVKEQIKGSEDENK